MKLIQIVPIYFLFLILLISCDVVLPLSNSEDSVLDGNIEGLNNSELQQFLRGDAAFNKLIFTKETGLGPIFVSNSCGSCHTIDGKGHPFSAITRYNSIDTTLNSLEGNLHQIQNLALPGYLPEILPKNVKSTKLLAPINTGLGYLELVSDQDIISMSDPNDIDGDGISGVPSWNILPWYLKPNENSISQNGKYIHRFGKKGISYNLLNQVVKAFNQDIGITSVFEPKDVFTHQDIEPEINQNVINDIVQYLRTLKAPIQRNQNNSDVIDGKIIFKNIGCNSCHKEILKTGFSQISAFSNKEFYPYTDLLLHNMGSNLDDEYTEGSALSSEWRTVPLWGLGLAPNSQGGKYYLLHDGRASSIEEAILYHGGEASQRKSNYIKLSQTDKNKLIKFLESL